MIRLQNVSFGYDKNNTILKNITLDIEDGDSIGLIGANGAGKTTLMKVLLGLLPYEGEITVNSIKVATDNLKEIRRELGYVLQNSDNQMFMPTVYEDMMFGLINNGMSEEAANARVEEVLSQLGLSDLKASHNHKLSGGEKRMAAIATILAMSPTVLLMDEPTSALDPYNRRVVINAINSLSVTKLIAAHDLDMIMDTCNKVVLISEGTVVAQGTTEEILKDKALLESNRMELPLSMSRNL